MQWISALLAFAATMLFFTIVVSILVEMIHRALRLREAGLHVMLQKLYKSEIGKHIKPAVGTTAAVNQPAANQPAARPPAANQPAANQIAANQTVADPTMIPGQSQSTKDATEFADMITGNRAIDGVAPGIAGLLSQFSEPLRLLVNASSASNLPVEVFMQKLQTYLAEKKIEPIQEEEKLKDIAQKFEAYGAEASDYFERRARFFSVAISIVVAFWFYVHPYNLAVAYVKNPDLAQSVAKMSEELTKQSEALEAQIKQRGGDEQGAKGTSEAPATADAANQATSPATDDQLKAALDDVNKTLSDVRQKVHGLADFGVPFGWPADAEIAGLAACPSSAKSEPSHVATAPLSAPESAVIRERGADSSLTYIDFCRDEAGNRVHKSPWLSYLWLALGGLLIGLGGPFWISTISSLAYGRDVAAKIGDIVNSGKVVTTEAAGTVNIQDRGSTAVNAFQVAAKAGKLPTGPGPALNAG